MTMLAFGSLEDINLNSVLNNKKSALTGIRAFQSDVEYERNN